MKWSETNKFSGNTSFILMMMNPDHPLKEGLVDVVAEEMTVTREEVIEALEIRLGIRESEFEPLACDEFE